MWFCHGGRHTDALQSIPASLWVLITLEDGTLFSLWFEHGEDLQRWGRDSLTASDRRFLLYRRVATAVDIIDNSPGCSFRLSEQTGALKTTGGTGDDRTKLEGLTEPLAFVDDGSEDEAVGVGGVGE